VPPLLIETLLASEYLVAVGYANKDMKQPSNTETVCKQGKLRKGARTSKKEARSCNMLFMKIIVL
jgi:hypothetical protein